MTVGVDQDNRVHGCLVHIEIIDGKLWIQRDGTEQGIATELAAAAYPNRTLFWLFIRPRFAVIPNMLSHSHL